MPEPTRDQPPSPPATHAAEGRARLLSGALWLGIVIALFVILIHGKAFIVPLVLAIFAMYLIPRSRWRGARFGSRVVSRLVG
jgi:hypothetical protein